MYKSYITSIEVVYDFIRGVLACIGKYVHYTLMDSVRGVSCGIYIHINV